MTLEKTYHRLPKSLWDICGKVTFPSDNGITLMTLSSKVPNKLGANDASYHQNRATHAWMISMGHVLDIMLPNKTIFGSGPVDGLSP
jgi:hypothetical protein